MHFLELLGNVCKGDYISSNLSSKFVSYKILHDYFEIKNKHQNVVEILGRDYSEEKVEMFFQHADLDMDGKISFDDFLNAFRLENSNELETLYTRERSRSEDRSLVGIDTFIPGGKYDT